MNITAILARLRTHANPAGMTDLVRYGINPATALCIKTPILRALAREIGKSHELAQQLWNSDIHEARILSSMVDEYKLVTPAQMEAWARDFNSWDVCDQVCANLFDKTPFAYEKAKKWTSESEEFYKRAGFALIAALAWHDKEVSDKKLKEFFPYIKKHATDERNYVKKAVNWALRQIGKKRQSLTKPSINCAEEILKLYPNSKSARFIANDAIRELKKR